MPKDQEAAVAPTPTTITWNRITHVSSTSTSHMLTGGQDVDRISSSSSVSRPSVWSLTETGCGSTSDMEPSSSTCSTFHSSSSSLPHTCSPQSGDVPTRDTISDLLTVKSMTLKIMSHLSHTSRERSHWREESTPTPSSSSTTDRKSTTMLQSSHRDTGERKRPNASLLII